ncbi:hypothetical protein, partial [Polaromonas sp.]|uniref:hypothetical protein n=1 Tax=Polaromonas sp. TaxID=1869339 RepID=UPI00326323C9
VSDHHVFSRDVCTVPKNSRREFQRRSAAAFEAGYAVAQRNWGLRRKAQAPISGKATTNQF